MSRIKQPRPVEVGENELNYRELVAFLKENPTAFRLGLAHYDQPATRDATICGLVSELGERGVRISIVDFASTPEDKLLLRRLRRHLDSLNPETRLQAILVVNIEATLDYGSKAPAEGMAAFTNANIQRDAFVLGCPVPVVLWLNTLAAAAFARHAPDLWHWRSGTFHFEGPPAEKAEFEDWLIYRPEMEISGLSLASKKEHLAYLQDLLVRLEEAPDKDTPGQKARRVNLLNQLGMLYLLLHQPPCALAYFDQALQLARQVGDRQNEATALCNLGGVYRQMGKLDQAVKSFEQSLALAREVSNRRSEGEALDGLAEIYTVIGNPRQSIKYSEQALALAHELNDREQEGNALGRLGSAYRYMGELDRAIELHDQQLAIARQFGDRSGEETALCLLGHDYLNTKEPSRALEFYEQLLAIAREIKNRRDEGVALSCLGNAYRVLGEPRRASAFLEQSLAITREVGDSQTEAYAEWCLSGVHHTSFDWDRCKCNPKNHRKERCTDESQ